jgi:hypothetical protein
LPRHRTTTPNLLLKAPFILDFLNLNDRYLEKDLEDAILRDIEQFLLELGAEFTFIARRKRLQIDNDDYFIRCVNRTIAISSFAWAKAIVSDARGGGEIVPNAENNDVTGKFTYDRNEIL